MKAKAIFTSILFMVMFNLTSFVQGQNCANKEFSDIDPGDFDYQGQSSFAKLSPGDTARIKIVVYSNQMYRIFFDSDPKLGDVRFKLINPIRKSKKVIQSISQDTTRSYKMDANGSYLNQDNEVTEDRNKFVVTGEKIIKDTVFSVVRYTEEKVIFDNKSNKTGKDYWEQAPKKTERMFIDIAVPEGNAGISGCVNVYVGNKILSSKTFAKEGKTRITED
jgi:hypothetical protein